MPPDYDYAQRMSDKNARTTPTGVSIMLYFIKCLNVFLVMNVVVNELSPLHKFTYASENVCRMYGCDCLSECYIISLVMNGTRMYECKFVDEYFSIISLGRKITCASKNESKMYECIMNVFCECLYKVLYIAILFISQHYV